LGFGRVILRLSTCFAQGLMDAAVVRQLGNAVNDDERAVVS
jgi:hypothetical protein